MKRGMTMHLKKTLEQKSAQLAELQSVKLDKRRKQLTPEQEQELTALQTEVEDLQNTIATRSKIQGAFSGFPFGGGGGLQYRGPDGDVIHEEQILHNLETLTEILCRVGERYNAMEREIHDFTHDAACVGRMFARILPGAAELLAKEPEPRLAGTAEVSQAGTLTFSGAPLKPGTFYHLFMSEVK
jgi:hypothetical protein